MHKELNEMNNEEFIAYLITSTPFGALTPIFILESINFYSTIISAEKRPEPDPEAAVCPLLWHDIARDINARFKVKYES